MILNNNRSEMTWYDQRNIDFENKILIDTKLLLKSIEAEDIVIQGKDSWGVDIILFNWNNHSHEIMMILYDGPGKSQIIITNLVTGKSINFENETSLESKITINSLKYLLKT